MKLETQNYFGTSNFVLLKISFRTDFVSMSYLFLFLIFYFFSLFLNAFFSCDSNVKNFFFLLLLNVKI